MRRVFRWRLRKEKDSRAHDARTYQCLTVQVKDYYYCVWQKLWPTICGPHSTAWMREILTLLIFENLRSVWTWRNTTRLKTQQNTVGVIIRKTSCGTQHLQTGRERRKSIKMEEDRVKAVTYFWKTCWAEWYCVSITWKKSQEEVDKDAKDFPFDKWKIIERGDMWKWLTGRSYSTEKHRNMTWKPPRETVTGMVGKKVWS